MENVSDKDQGSRGGAHVQLQIKPTVSEECSKSLILMRNRCTPINGKNCFFSEATFRRVMGPEPSFEQKLLSQLARIKNEKQKSKQQNQEQLKEKKNVQPAIEADPSTKIEHNLHVKEVDVNDLDNHTHTEEGTNDTALSSADTTSTSPGHRNGRTGSDAVQLPDERISSCTAGVSGETNSCTGMEFTSSLSSKKPESSDNPEMEMNAEEMKCDETSDVPGKDSSQLCLVMPSLSSDEEEDNESSQNIPGSFTSNARQINSGAGDREAKASLTESQNFSSEISAENAKYVSCFNQPTETLTTAMTSATYPAVLPPQQDSTVSGPQRDQCSVSWQMIMQNASTMESYMQSLSQQNIQGQTASYNFTPPGNTYQDSTSTADTAWSESDIPIFTVKEDSPVKVKVSASEAVSMSRKKNTIWSMESTDVEEKMKSSVETSADNAAAKEVKKKFQFKQSDLTKAEHQQYMKLFNKYVKPYTFGGQPPIFSNKQLHELTMFEKLQRWVLKEQTEFQNYLQENARKTPQMYLHIKPAAKHYSSRKACSYRQKKAVTGRFSHSFHSKISLNPEAGKAELVFQQAILEVGVPPRINMPDIQSGNKPVPIPYNIKKIDSWFPRSSKPKVNGHIHHEFVSLDDNARALAAKYRVQAVLSSSVMKCLLDNHGPNYDRVWNIPVHVVELQSEGEEPHKVVFLDKPVFEDNLQPRDYNALFHKYALRTFVSHPKQRHNKEGKKLFQQSNRAPVRAHTDVNSPVLDDLFDISSTDVDSIETFGGGVSSTLLSGITAKRPDNSLSLAPDKGIRNKATEEKLTLPSTCHIVTEKTASVGQDNHIKNKSLSDGQSALQNETDEITESMKTDRTSGLLNEVYLEPKPTVRVTRSKAALQSDIMIDNAVALKQLSSVQSDPVHLHTEAVVATCTVNNENMAGQPISIEATTSELISSSASEPSIQNKEFNDVANEQGLRRSTRIKTQAKYMQDAEDVECTTVGVSKSPYTTEELTTAGDEDKHISSMPLTDMELSDVESSQQSQTAGTAVTRSRKRVRPHQSLSNQAIEEINSAGEPQEKHKRQMPNINTSILRSSHSSNVCGPNFDMQQARKLGGETAMFLHYASHVTENQASSTENTKTAPSCSEWENHSPASPTASPSSQIASPPASPPQGNSDYNRSIIVEIPSSPVQDTLSPLQSLAPVTVIPLSPEISSSPDKKASLSDCPQPVPKRNITHKYVGSAQSKLFTPLDTILGPSMGITTKKEDRSIPQEDPAHHLSPTEVCSSISYNLWSIGSLPVLIRSRCHGVLKDQKKSRRVYLRPKMEYQTTHGLEQVTVNEVIRDWVSCYVRPKTNLLRARINAFTSELLMLEELETYQILQSSLNFKPESSFYFLQEVLQQLTSLDCGKYLLSHEEGEHFCGIRAQRLGMSSEREEPEFSLPKKKNYTNNTIPWVPIDPTILLPHHINHNRIPATFLPKDFVVPPGGNKKRNQGQGHNKQDNTKNRPNDKGNSPKGTKKRKRKGKK